MKDMIIPSKWRKTWMIVLAIVSLSCAVIVGCLKYIIKYDYKQVDPWNYKNKSHIGNISKYDNRGYELDGNWRNIGNRSWYANDLDEVEPNKAYGNLLRLYSYYTNDKENKHYGEDVSLWIYEAPGNTDEQVSFYKNLYHSLANDTTVMFEVSKSFKPLMALSTRPRAVFELNQGRTKYIKDILIFANHRLYSFHISNDKIESKGLKTFWAFDKRCAEIVKSVDLLSYSQWENDYQQYQEISKKEANERDFWCKILLFITWTSLVLLFSLPKQKPGKANLKARYLCFYVDACFLISILFLLGVILTTHFGYEKMSVWMVGTFAMIGATVIYTFLSTFLSRRSNETFYSTYLIPNRINKALELNSEFKKRLLMVFLFFPLFYLVPFPVFGWWVFVCYVLPVCIILILTSIITHAITYVREGKSTEKKDKPDDNIARLYCRHCGKLIDADSDYCRYCGKEL